MQLKDLIATDTTAVEQAAALLVVGFTEHSPNAWPTQESALAEVRESFGPGRIRRVALDAAGSVVGWVGGIRALTASRRPSRKTADAHPTRNRDPSVRTTPCNRVPGRSIHRTGAERHAS